MAVWAGQGRLPLRRAGIMAAVGPGHPRAAPTPRAATTSTRGPHNLRRWVRLGRPRPAVPKPDVGAELGAESLHDDGVRLGATVLQRFRRRRLGKHQHYYLHPQLHILSTMKHT